MGYAALCWVRDPRGSSSSVPVPERSPALTTTSPRAEPLPDPGSFRQHRQPQPRRAAGPAAGHPAPPGRSSRSREGAGGNTAFWGRLRPGRVPPHLLAPGGSAAVPPAPGIPPLIAEGIPCPVESSKVRAALAAPLSSRLKTNPSGSMDLVRDLRIREARSGQGAGTAREPFSRCRHQNHLTQLSQSRLQVRPLWN